EPIRPYMCAALGVDKLHIYRDVVASPPHAAFNYVTNAEVPTELLHVDGFALVSQGGGVGGHKAVGDARKIGGQIVGDSLGQIFLVRIARQIGKGQNDERQA